MLGLCSRPASRLTLPCLPTRFVLLVSPTIILSWSEVHYDPPPVKKRLSTKKCSVLSTTKHMATCVKQRKRVTPAGAVEVGEWLCWVLSSMKVGLDYDQEKDTSGSSCPQVFFVCIGIRLVTPRGAWRVAWSWSDERGRSNGRSIRPFRRFALGGHREDICFGGLSIGEGLH